MVPLTARSNGGTGSDVPKNMHYEPQSDIGPSGFTLASSSMSSARTIRDPVLDHLITPQNSAMIITDFQRPQISSVTSRDKDTLIRNVVSMAQLGKLFGLPVVLSTVNVKTGINEPMIKPITDVFPYIEPIDRTAITPGKTRISSGRSRQRVAKS